VTDSSEDDVAVREVPQRQAADAVGTEVGGILDTIEIPIVVVGRDCKVTRFNRAATETLGVSSADLGRHMSSLQSLAGIEGIEQLCVQAMLDGLPSRRDVPNGDRWFVVHIAPYIGTEQRVRGAVLTFTNVTAFRASLAQAIYEREYTKTILNAVMDPLLVLDAGRHVQTANRAFYTWFGVSRDQTQRASLRDMGGHAWKVCGLWDSLEATLNDGREFQTIELEDDFPGVGRRTVLIDARRLARDKNALVLVALKDITDRKRTEQSLRESEARFRTLFESMNEGYCVVEMIFDDADNPTDYRFLEVNPVFEKQTGIKDARGRLMRQIAPNHEQHWFDIYGRIALTGETMRFENPASALQRYYDVCAFRVGAPELRRVGVVFNDITARKNLERQRELLLAEEAALRAEAERAVAAKDRFLAALSHELRTPLSPVVLAVSAMENHPEFPLALHKYVAVIRRNIELEIRLIDDLLDVSRVTSGKMSMEMLPTHLHGLISEVVRSCASETSAKKLAVHLALHAENDLVTADSARLQQVFSNLLRNAAKFTPQGGNIFIRTENAGGSMRVEVQDTGIGIAAEVLPKVFDAFEQGDIKITRQFGGLGLGLSICKSIVNLHGGAICAQSAGPGTGATFTVELPTAAATTPEASAGQPVGQPAGPQRADQHLCVLLVEDHSDSREMLASVLGALNYIVRTASCVERALELAAIERVDIVVSDLGLPDGTGWDLMKQLRDRYGIKGIALSGYGMGEDQQRSRDAGFVGHVVKPVNAMQLAAVIERVARG
jgi:PAS domain S-box-containing protein